MDYDNSPLNLIL